jgi:hypothetical protein
MDGELEFLLLGVELAEIVVRLGEVRILRDGAVHELDRLVGALVRVAEEAHQPQRARMARIGTEGGPVTGFGFVEPAETVELDPDVELALDARGFDQLQFGGLRHAVPFPCRIFLTLRQSWLSAG